MDFSNVTVIEDLSFTVHRGEPFSPEYSRQLGYKAGREQALFDFPADPSTQSVKVYGADRDIFGNGLYGSVATALPQASAAERLDAPRIVPLVSGQITTVTATYRDGHEAAGINGVIAPILYLVAFYLVILMLGNQMLASTLDEKENRVTEMILTIINPTSLILIGGFALFTGTRVAIGARGSRTRRPSRRCCETPSAGSRSSRASPSR